MSFIQKKQLPALIKNCMVVFAFILPSLLHGQNSYFVDQANGNDGNTGTALNPFRTINHASGISQPGDTINVLPGIYDADDATSAFDNIPIANSGAPDNYITYRGISDASGNKPTIVSASIAGFTVFEKSYIVIENFEVTTVENDINNVIGALGLQLWQERVGFNILQNSHHIIVRDCYVHDFRGNGFQCASADVVLIENNLLEHNAFQSDNGNSGISMFQMQDMPVPGFPEYPNHRLIIRNNISRYNVNLRGFRGFEDRLTDGNGIIIDDLRHEQGDNIPYTGRTLVIGNSTYGNGGYGINIFSSDQVDIFNNTMYDNAHTTRIANPAYEVSVQDAVLQIGNATDINVKNNILYNSGDGPTINSFNLGTVTFNSNIHWNSTGTINPNIDMNAIVVDPLLTSVTGLTQSQTDLFATMTNPFDENSISASVRTPTVNNAFPIHDITLQASSPAIDNGVDCGLIPIEGNGLDIGALEFIVPTTPLFLGNRTALSAGDLKENISIYPTVTSSDITIDFRALKSPSPIRLTVYNISGQIVTTTTVDPIKYTLNMSVFEKGTYLIHIQQNENTITEKVIVE